VPDTVVPAVRSVPGVQNAEPIIQGPVTLIKSNGKALTKNGPPTIGVSWDPDRSLSSLHLVTGTAPSAADEVVIDVGRYDPVTQILDLNHIHISADGIVLSPISLRLACPPEFDLMARIAGLRLRDRWGGWNGEPYTAASWRHISSYEPAPGR